MQLCVYGERDCVWNVWVSGEVVRGFITSSSVVAIVVLFSREKGEKRRKQKFLAARANRQASKQTHPRAQIKTSKEVEAEASKRASEGIRGGASSSSAGTVSGRR